MSDYLRLVRTTSQPEKLVKVSLLLGATFAANATHFWTFTLRRRRVGQEFGEQIGETYSLATRTVTGGEPVTIYDDARGVVLADGETLWATVSSFGSPSVPTSPSLVLTIQRIAR